MKIHKEYVLPLSLLFGVVTAALVVVFFVWTGVIEPTDHTAVIDEHGNRGDVTSFCDEHGNRVYLRGDGATDPLFVVGADPTCTRDR